MFGMRYLLIGGVILAVIGGVTWLRYDAQSDLLDKLNAEHNKGRISDITQSAETQNEISNSTVSELDAALCLILYGATGCLDGAAVQGREPPAPASTAGHD